MWLAFTFESINGLHIHPKVAYLCLSAGEALRQLSLMNDIPYFLSSCHADTVKLMEPDFLHQDFSVCHRFRQKKWGWGTMLISASH